MTTTAKLREKARYNAALCWDDAARLYPQPYPQSGELAERDYAV